MSKYRRERLSDRIKELLARELATFRDPRLQFITVTEVRVTGDLKLARIYWSVPASQLEGASNEEGACNSLHADGDLIPKGLPGVRSLGVSLPGGMQVEETARALRGAVGALRACLAKELTLRLVPQIEFLYDESAVYGAKIDGLLSKISG